MPKGCVITSIHFAHRLEFIPVSMSFIINVTKVSRDYSISPLQYLYNWPEFARGIGGGVEKTFSLALRPSTSLS